MASSYNRRAMELPDEGALRRLVAAYAGLRGAHGDGIGTPALVEPTVQFFPEPIRNDAASIAGVLRAMVGHSPVADDLPLELAFRIAEDEDGGGCSSGACHAPGAEVVAKSGVEETPSGYRVVLEAPALRHLDALAASLARAVGALVLFEVNEDASAARSEVAAIACGFGVLVTNGAAVWSKSCGGLRMARSTALSVEEAAVGLALFVALHGERPAKARKYLGASQREAFAGACDWVDSNPELVERLHERPSTLASSTIEIEPVRGIVGNWLHRRAVKRQNRVPPQLRVAPSPPLSDEKRRRLEEARALVDDVFGQAERK
jgi:hypothetical protein